MRRLALVFLLVLLGACASPARLSAIPALDAAPALEALLLGEQHDAAEHQRLHRQVIEKLAARGQLAGVALEMAEQGASTAGLPRDADEAGVRSALRWNDAAWPWTAYGAAVMAAVRAGVPVLGANLPRSRFAEAMADAKLDATVPPEVLRAQHLAIRAGHCGLLPETRIGSMTRIQLARDRAMAQTLMQMAVAGGTVVLVAGAGHVDPNLGVPRHLPASLRALSHAWPREPRDTDYCAQLRQQMKPAP